MSVVKRDLIQIRCVALCCRCGGRATYAAHSFLHFARRDDIMRTFALCELHGRAFAIRWKLELPGEA